MRVNLFKNKSFIAIWLGNATSELGGAFGTFCNSLIVYQLTGSPLALSSMWLLYFLPSLALQLFIGPYIDKWSRKWIMVFTLWSRVLIFLIPLVGYMTSSIAPWHIYIVQVSIGLITPLYVPANQAILPTIVPKEQLIHAYAYVDGMNRLMTFLAPVVAGIIINYIGIDLTLGLICVLLSSSGLLILGVKEERNIQPIRKSWAEQFVEGISYFFKNKTIVWLGIFLAFVQFGVGVAMVINLPYINEVLNQDYAVYGYFMASFPLGYVLGSLLVGQIKLKSGNRRLFMLGSLTVGGLTYINLGITNSIYLAVLTEIIAGIAMAFFNNHNISILQETVPNHLMGKIFSVRSLITRGVMPIGVLAGGLLSELWDIRILYIIIGMIIAIVSLIGIIIPYFRFIDGASEESYT
ncbi:Predicted arabinose efflux permease, MFS family [Paenibacillaceae bacterium GAS479]|nr:Predicted arabinose efflux permease, MFS family [Paenibacillaceae bacterium GAS479]